MITYILTILYIPALGSYAETFNGYYAVPKGNPLWRLVLDQKRPHIEYQYSGRYDQTFKNNFENIVIPYFREKTCFRFQEHDPKHKKNKTVLLRLSSVNFECRGEVLGQRFAILYLHQKLCWSVYHMINAMMEAFGLHAVDFDYKYRDGYYSSMLSRMIHLERRKYLQNMYSLYPASRAEFWPKMSFYLAAQPLTFQPNFTEDFVSFQDIRRLNAMYCNCHLKDRYRCQHGGYTSPLCTECICPLGFMGRFCQELYEDTAMCGPQDFTLRDPRGGISFGYNGPMACGFRVKAPKGRRIEFTFNTKRFDMHCQEAYFCNDFIEVKMSKDLSVSGYRYCCPHYIHNWTLRCESNEILIYMHHRSASHKGSGFDASVSMI